MASTIERRDSRGHFIRDNVPWNKRVDSPQREMTSLVVPRVIGGGVLKLERVQVICPACGQQVEAVAKDGQAKGYCVVAKQYVDFPIETQRAVETKAEIPAGPTPMRDSRVRFVKGNVPLNKKEQSH